MLRIDLRRAGAGFGCSCVLKSVSKRVRWLTGFSAASDLILSRARSLEKHVWEENPPPAGSATYRNKMRSFYLNLKAANNPGLREGVVSGEISIVELYNMDPKVRHP